MPSNHHDEVREYSFADKALALRKRAGLTQREVADLLGVSARAIGAWEAGLSYPGSERVKQLMVIYVERGVFAAGREAEEASALWASVRGTGARRVGPFDTIWFASLRGGNVATPAPPADAPAAVAAQPFPRHDWGEAPDVPEVQGRTQELATLVRWVREERFRVVEVLGAGGIGKTTVAARLAQDLASEFPVIFWRSLRNAPPVEDWLAGAIAALSAAQALPPNGLEAKLALLMEMLRAQRGLLVLDNLETVLEPGAPAVRYRPGYEGYGEALRRLGESAHQGCLLLTSREKPLREDEVAVRALRLEGLGVEDGRALLGSRALAGDETDWRTLTGRYAGNPFALRVVGETIGEVFEGEIAAFLAQDAMVFGDVRQLLDEQVARLSPLEHAVLTWLAVEREPVGFAELAAELGPTVGRAEMVEAVEALRRRSLLEPGGRGTFTLQPLVLEYATAQLVGRVGREVLEGEPALLVTHALVKAQAKDYVRRCQELLIAQPLLDQLRTSSGSAEAVERLLRSLLEAWRGRGREEQAYGPGGVVNLLRLLRGDLRGLDLSRLSIRQAYLQEVEAQDASFAGAHLTEVLLAETFNYPVSVALSADDASLAAGTSLGEVCLWRVADRTPLLAVHGHAGTVLGVALSEDGRLLASGSMDGTVRLWEATRVSRSQGRLLAILEGHAGGVLDVALSGDGHIVAAGNYDGTVSLWEATPSRASLWRLLANAEGHIGPVVGVALSGDGRLLASGGVDGTARLWETSGGRLLATLEGHTSLVYGVALSEDGRLLASCSMDGTIRLWDATPGGPLTGVSPPGRLLAILQGRTGMVLGVALSGDGRLLASGGANGTVQVWEAPSGRLLATLQGHASLIHRVALSGEGRLLATCSLDGAVKLWGTTPGEPGTRAAAELTPTAGRVAGGNAFATVTECDIEPPVRLQAILLGHTNGYSSVALSGDGRLLVGGSFDTKVRLWEVSSGHLLATLQGHNGGVPRVALSGDGSLMVTGSTDGTVKLWETLGGQLLATLEGHTGGVYGVALSGDGRVLASGSFYGTVKLWETSSGQLKATLQGPSVVLDIALSEDGQVLASGGGDGAVRLWETHTGSVLTTLRGHTSAVQGVALSGDGHLVASGSEDGTVRLWEAWSGQPLATLVGHTGGVHRVALSAGGRLVASGSVDRTVRLWEAPSGRPLATLRGHTGAVPGVAMSGDGRLVASGGADGTIKLWDTKTGICLGTLQADRRYERMDISGLTGVTEAQRAALVALGAIEQAPA